MMFRANDLVEKDGEFVLTDGPLGVEQEDSELDELIAKYEEAIIAEGVDE